MNSLCEKDKKLDLYLQQHNGISEEPISFFFVTLCHFGVSVRPLCCPPGHILRRNNPESSLSFNFLIIWKDFGPQLWLCLFFDLVHRAHVHWQGFCVGWLCVNLWVMPNSSGLQCRGQALLYFTKYRQMIKWEFLHPSLLTISPLFKGATPGLYKINLIMPMYYTAVSSTHLWCWMDERTVL